MCIACGAARSSAGPRKGEWRYRRCRRCGLLTLEPMPSAGQIAAHYEQARNYEVARRYAGPYRRVHEQLAGWIDVQPGERVLDVGCFTGELLAILQARGADVHGIELQAHAAATANERLGAGRVVRADVESYGERGRFAVVTMMGLVEHVRDPRALLGRARELLEPGGRLYLQTPDGASLPARVLGRAWPPLAPVEHVHLFTARALRALLEREGFTDVRTRAHMKWLPASYVYEQLATFGGRGWQRTFAPVVRLLGDRTLPFYGGEMFVSARRR